MWKATKDVLWILNKKERRFALLLGIMMLFGAIMESLSVSLILPLVSAISNTESWSETFGAKFICNLFGISDQRTYIKLMLASLMVMFLVKNVYLIAERYIQNSFIAKSRLKMQTRLMHRYARKNYDFFLNSSSGEIVRIINGDTVQAFSVLMAVLSFYTEGMVCIILSVTLVVISPKISCFLIVMLILEMLLITKVITPINARLGQQNRTDSALANKWMLGLLNGIKSIKVSGAADYFESQYDYYANRTIDTQRKNQTLTHIPKLIIETISVVAVLGMVLVMVQTGAELSSLLPILSAFAVAAIRLLPCVSIISADLNNLKFWDGGLRNIIAILEEDEDSEEEESSDAECLPLSFNDGIQFRNISYRYPGSDRSVLENASLEIKKGQSVGIVGPSGAGKTTTVDIILGLLKPEQGEVLVDGVNIEDNMRGWLSRLAYIPQQIFLMDDSIKHNVAFGIPEEEISEAKVWEALKDAQLDDYVRSLPQGIETGVGERGIRLSGGQCQRIGIARALYNNPDILVFDEATSSLDNETEKAIMKSIDGLKGRKTMLIIAHRLTTIENCDVIYKVNGGSITKS